MATEKRSKEGGPPSGLRAPTSSVSYRDVPSDSANIDRADNVRRTTVYVSWWKRRSPTEKRLIVCLPLFIILLIVVIVVITAVTVPSPAELLGRKLNTSLEETSQDVTSSTEAICSSGWTCVNTTDDAQTFRSIHFPEGAWFYQDAALDNSSLLADMYDDDGSRNCWDLAISEISPSSPLPSPPIASPPQLVAPPPSPYWWVNSEGYGADDEASRGSMDVNVDESDF